ncbi:MAG: glucosyltransferase [Clostridia bacterium]|jgi:MGT family glycosyltransferase|nr:glucosyltransferase [Clostridia bacterium]
MRIAWFSIPAYGHTNPTIGVVKELVSRGHEVYYYSFNQFKDVIEDAGAHFISCDEFDLGLEQESDMAERIGKDMVLSTQVIVNATLSMDEKLEKDMAEIKPDVIVADSVAYWGKLIAMKLSIPFVSSTTTFAFNKESAKIMKPSGKEMLKMIFDIPKTRKLLKPLRDKGYPAENILTIIQNDNDTTTVVYTSKMFQPHADSFSDRYTFVGAIPKETKEIFNKTKEKLVYIALGTVDNKHPDFYKNCIEAFRGTDYQVIMSVGRETDLSSFNDVPENVEIYTFVDQVAVLKVADVFLTHCGMNSASESLFFGVPLVLFPQTPEQGGVANRIEELGAGKKLTDTNPSSINKCVEDVLLDSRYRERARELGDGLKNCPGAVGAADAIERAFRKNDN